jgi:4-carboxymuconolactone decarboxylase
MCSSGTVWADPALSQRDRSLITVSIDNGLSSDKLAAAMTHVAFYAGWPAGMTGVTELKKITEE